MSDERKYYCYCDSNCKFETMTKEQILAAIAQAVETGSVGNCDTGFVTKVKEQNGGSCVTFWVGTRAQYNAIETKEQNCMYIITDDTTSADILRTCQKAITDAESANATAAAANETATTAQQMATAASEVAAQAQQMATAANETATAANETATQAKQTATTALQKVTENGSIDFTDSVKFSSYTSWGNKNMTVLSVSARRFEYNPTTGLVHFLLHVDYKGTMEKGAGVSFVDYSNKHIPIDTEIYPVCDDRGQFKATVAYEDKMGTMLTIVATEDINVTSTNTAMFSGWYFAENT